ncbi:beta-CASP ribonuclease aCPSF1 [Candidatus Micrarchaeota archaeon]|nr:beta-CASP ribonuclease aCPSF1 [Candidatus Micrarchaeota archaeon]
MDSNNAVTVKDLEHLVKEVLPPQCELTKVEPEGPQVVLYLKNIKAFYEDDKLITKIAAKVRKKILLRVDASALMPPTKALEEVKSLIPVEAGVADIKFDPVFHEVVIEALKPGLVIGKGGSVLKSIILTTGWSPRVLRSPTSPSEIEKAIRNSLIINSESRKKFLNTLGKKMLSPPSSCDWVKMTALGAFKEVGRSCILIQTPKSNVLLDCGMNIDTSDPTRAYPYLSAMGLSLDQLDAVILSHAHLDHSGFIPYLYKYGYDGPVYCTPPTRDLTVLLQQDCMNVMNSETQSGAPFGEKDVKKQLNNMICRDYGEVTDVTPDIRFTFYNAGHILGSASVHLHIGDGLHNLVYSADIKYGRTNLFDPAETRFPRAETLILESTYGGKDDLQPRLEDCESRLVKIIRDAIERKGKVLIPVFAVGRAQEIMLILENGLRDLNVPVYIDGMSKEASAIHTVYPEYLRKNVQRRILQNNSPFEHPMFNNVVSKERKDIAESEEPAVILAPAGMLSGGTSLQFLKMLAHDEKNSLVFVGYQSALSLGRKIQSGAKEVPVMNERSKLDALKINMSVYTVDGFSGHADRSQLLAYIRNLRPKPQRIFTNHGDEAKCEELARSLNKMMHIESRSIMNLDTIRLR